MQNRNCYFFYIFKWGNAYDIMFYLFYIMQIKVAKAFL